jgi:hypothetical protein
MSYLYSIVPSLQSGAPWAESDVSAANRGPVHAERYQSSQKQEKAFYLGVTKYQIMDTMVVNRLW